MNKYLLSFLTLLIFGSLTATAYAETEYEISGQVRVRNEFDEKFLGRDYYTRSFQILRTRITVDATVDSNAHAFVQFQDSRMFGDRDLYGNLQSGTLNDGRNVDIHQAYIQVDRVAVDGLGGKAGRFEFNLGNQRVFGAVGWHNVGRSWEGVQVWYERPGYQVTGFYLKAYERNHTQFHRDYDIYGGVLAIESLNLELFGAYEWNAERGLNSNALNRISLGGYLKRQHHQFDLEANAVYQTGDMDDVDIAAYMVTGEIGYTFQCDRKTRLALGFDISSGDDTPNDSESKTYNNLYYTGHKFRGHMDYFLSSNTAGLMDLMFRARTNPAKGWVLKTDFHYFMTAQDYLDPYENALTSDVGLEIDASVVTTRIKGITFATGISVFLPQESFVRLNTGNPLLTESDPTWWVYNQATM
ncbi:MAG: alginate export family protein, partial [bacterium]|nr:alginate export family protein [bacterium]